MFYRLPNGDHLNVAQIHKLTFDGEYTRIFFSQMQHDCLKLEGDVRPDILAAYEQHKSRSRS
jgi:hypothetical protein